MFDYIRWRGDLTFDRDGLNEVDNLIFSRAAYFPLDEIVPADFEKTIPLGEACRRMLALPDVQGRVCLAADVPLMGALADCARFAGVPVRGFSNQVEHERELQFAAAVFSFLPETHFVAFRGTDNTLVGWKEDFNMTFQTPVPAQLEAADYLRRAAAALPGTLIPGGHSKGGNLAVYAAACADEAVRARIPSVWSNDGPGFESSLLRTEGYLAVREKLRTFVPQSSVVGMLLSHEEDYTVVQSTQVGPLQHDPFSWQVQGKSFVSLERVTDGARFMDRTLHGLLAGLTNEQREKVVDAVYDLFRQTGVETVGELSADKFGSARAILRSVAGMDAETKEQVLFAVGVLFRAAMENLGEMLKQRGAAGG